ncbi:MAG: hypothetical protein ACI376_00550 [Candidatus Bruticola sp.]
MYEPATSGNNIYGQDPLPQDVSESIPAVKKQEAIVPQGDRSLPAQYSAGPLSSASALNKQRTAPPAPNLRGRNIAASSSSSDQRHTTNRVTGGAVNSNSAVPTPMRSNESLASRSASGSAAPAAASLIGGHRTEQVVNPRLRYTSQSRRNAPLIEEASSASKAALAMEKPSLAPSAKLQADATSLPYKTLNTQHPTHLESPLHTSHPSQPTNSSGPYKPGGTISTGLPQPQRAEEPSPYDRTAKVYQTRTIASLGNSSTIRSDSATPAAVQTRQSQAPTLGQSTNQPRSQAATLGGTMQPYQPRTAASSGSTTSIHSGSAAPAAAQARQPQAPTLGQSTTQSKIQAATLGSTMQPYQPRTAASLGSTTSMRSGSATPTAAQTRQTQAPTLGQSTNQPRNQAATLGSTMQPYQPRTAASLGNTASIRSDSAAPAAAQARQPQAPTLGQSTTQSKIQAATLGSTMQPYQPRTAASLGSTTSMRSGSATPTAAQTRQTQAPTLGQSTNQPRNQAATLGSTMQPYQPRTAASLGSTTSIRSSSAAPAAAQTRQPQAPTLGQSTTQSKSQAATLGSTMQPYQPRTAASLESTTSIRSGSAAPAAAQTRQPQAATLKQSSTPSQNQALSSRSTVQPSIPVSSALSDKPSSVNSVAASGRHFKEKQATDTSAPYQPGKAANYPSLEEAKQRDTFRTAEHTEKTSETKPKRRPNAASQPLIQANTSKGSSKHSQGGRVIPTISATPPKEFIKEKERKALLAQRVVEYNNIQAYYASYMANYEQQQNRLEQLIKDETISTIERAHLFKQQSELYQKQRALFQLQTNLYEYVSNKNFDPKEELPFTPLDEETNKPKNFNKSPEEHWSAILGSEIKKQTRKQRKNESKQPYKITKRHESVLERRQRRMEELKRWEKEWSQYYKKDPFWRKQRYWKALFFIIGVTLLIGLININNVMKWFASDYERPLVPIETNELKTNYKEGYISVHKGDVVPVDSRLVSYSSPYNVMAMRNGGNLRIDKYTDVTIENLKTNKNGNFHSSFYLKQGRVCAYSEPDSLVFMLTPQVRISPVNDQPTLYAAVLKTDGQGKQFTLLSVYRGMCVVGYNTGTLQTVRVSAGQSLKSYSSSLGQPDSLRQPDKWTKWNYGWTDTKNYVSPLASPKSKDDIDEIEDDTPDSAVEAFTKKQALDKQKEAAAKVEAAKKSRKAKAKPKSKNKTNKK